MGRKHIITLVAIMMVVAFCVSILAKYDIWGHSGMTFGLDLRGGVYLEYQVDFGNMSVADQQGRLSETKNIIERRINAWGVTEAEIYIAGVDRIVVQLPGFTNIDDAKQLVGKTAELIFCEQAASINTSSLTAVNVSDSMIGVGDVTGFGVGDVFGIGSGDTAEMQTIVSIDKGSNTFNVTPGFYFSHITGAKIYNQWTPAIGLIDGEEKALTGKYLLPNSYVSMNQQTSEPLVQFEWNADGATLFSQITGRLIGKQLGIFLDNELISAPKVNDQIGAKGVIEGMSLDEAQRLSIQLNTGALPLTLHEIRTQMVEPSLGESSLNWSLLAGIIALALIFAFMTAYYRLPGFVSCISLLIYGAMLLTIFKLVPVTLSAAGIAGVVVSIGMAIDANVLIFERMKEELRGGRSLGSAMELGFSRAWTAIRDSNLTTIISCAVLFWFGNAFGAMSVMGFALTLGIGVVVSMITAIIVTRAFMRTILYTPLAKSIKLFLP
jgi:protein-export membrane protein SecD